MYRREGVRVVMSLMKRFWCCALVCGLMPMGFAKQHWQRVDVDAGLVVNTGDTSSRNLDAALHTAYKWRRYEHQFETTFARVDSNDSGLTVWRWYVGGQTQYDFTDRLYIFGRANYLDDKFNGYSYIVNEIIGLGWFIIDDDRMKLSMQLGPGLQQKELETTGQKTNLFTGEALGKFQYKFNERVVFNQDVNVNKNSSNLRTTSVTALTSNLTDKLGFKVSVTVIKDSSPAAGKKDLNTMTNLTLTYSFI